MAKRKTVSFPTSYGTVTFLARPSGEKVSFRYRKKPFWQKIEEIGQEVTKLGLKLQELSRLKQSDKTGEKRG